MVVKIKLSKEHAYVLSELVEDESRWEELGAWGDINFPLRPARVTVVRLQQ